ncbi:DNA replication licensing factor MCM7 [Quillaja saponaria]|uniref:DNA replication licensing factor MCM7 n=1 Tax=Quillaja saponaria TaxID=32244 RepID=A0AAD7Q1D5_QUISA|nr:DNA replication licensing factor MCM7 [Quillaja saponaria]
MASYIGKLVRISGIELRCSDVKPLMQVAVYTCEDCGSEIYQLLGLTRWMSSMPMHSIGYLGRDIVKLS